MKKPFLLLLSSLLVLGPTLSSCKTVSPNNDNITAPDGESENNNDSTEGETDSNTDNNHDETEENDDETSKLPDFSNLETKTLKETKEICDKLDKSKNEFFSTEYVKTKGKVLSDFAISSSYHFIILADATGTFPIAVNASNAVTGYFYLGETYEVVGLAGNYLKHSCLKVEKRKNSGTITPIDKEDSRYENVDIETLTKEKTIAEVYDEAYTIKVADNKTNYSENLYKFRATYISKISDGLALVFDGENHIILHGDKKINNHLLENKQYDFYCFPSVSQGKRSAECVGFKNANIEDITAIQRMGDVAQLKTVNDLFDVDRYNDDKALYPNVFKVEGYISAHIYDNKYNLALVDDPNINPSYSKTNERPKAIYAKNHIIDEYSLSLSKSVLLKYYLSEPAKKGTFYFVITEYASALHVYKGYFLDSLIEFK